jgi:hypothetical protein
MQQARHTSRTTTTEAIEPALIREAGRWALEGLSEQIPERYLPALEQATAMADLVERANIRRFHRRLA